MKLVPQSTLYMVVFLVERLAVYLFGKHNVLLDDADLPSDFLSNTYNNSAEKLELPVCSCGVTYLFFRGLGNFISIQCSDIKYSFQAYGHLESEYPRQQLPHWKHEPAIEVSAWCGESYSAHYTSGTLNYCAHLHWEGGREIEERPWVRTWVL